MQLTAAIRREQNRPGGIPGRCPDSGSGAQASADLHTLLELGLITQQRSLTDPLRGRNSRHTVSDPMMRSWHHGVRPHLSQLQAGHAAHIWDEVIGPALDEFTSLHLATFGRTRTAGNLPGLLRPAGGEVGAIWPTKTVTDAEIDIAAQGKEGWLTGECKWTRGPVDRDDLKQLLRAERRQLTDQPILSRLLFARSGSHAGLQLPANMRAVAPDELFS